MIDLVSNFSTLFLVIVTVINLILTLSVIRSNVKSATNRIFAILGIDLLLWALAQYISLQPISADYNLFWVRVSTALAVPITPLFFVFIYTLPSENLKLSRSRMFLLFLPALAVVMLLLSPFAFVSVSLEKGIVNPTPGPGIIPFPIFLIISIFLVVSTFISRFKEVKGLEKSQLVYVTAGIVLMMVFIIGTIVIPVTVFRDVSFVPLFPLYTLFFTGLAGYAIIRHRLFNLKVLATEVLTILLWIILLSKIFVSPNFTETVIDIFVFIAVIFFGFLLMRSVNEEVTQRQKLEELTDRLKQLDAQKDEFISMAAHELRAPMTAVKGYISMVLEGDAGDIPDKVRGFLADTNSINERMIRLVNNMLNVSRIEEGRMVYQIETENMSRIVRAAYSEFTPEAERKGLDFILDIKPQIKDEVEVDVDKVHEVVTNLISNAVKYTDKGYVRVALTQPKTDLVKVEVEDTGTGISPEEQERLFKKFYRAESQVGKTIGTGLGLYISKLLIEKFGGKIGLKSEAEKGSTFWFELPIKGSPAAKTGEGS